MQGRMPVAFTRCQCLEYVRNARRLIHGELFSDCQVQAQVKERVQLSRFRKVVAIGPKTQTASCPLTNAPSEVSAEQLKETGIRLRTPRTA